MSWAAHPAASPPDSYARFYLEARAKAQPPTNSRAHADANAEDDADGDAAPRSARGKDKDDDAPEFQNPKPWETVVRIRVLASGSVGFGSGTVVYSSPKESLILTCAHIFKLEGQRQAPPQRFPRKIMIDLFDGKLHGEHPAQVHFVESVEGQAVDYDFTVDVGLIRIRPGRRLAAARVVPAHWQPRSKMLMMTVGCSEGQDATAWETIIQNPQMHGLSGNPSYQAIECKIAPKQGRSGGGLFTTDGYVAGVCNFAEPQGDHGLYATPRSIYSMLDRNKLTALYAPVESGQGTLVASRGDRGAGRGDAPITVARGQSPEGHDGERARHRPGDVTIPAPELLGIKPPLARRTSGRSNEDENGEGSTRRMAWQPAHPEFCAFGKAGCRRRGRQNRTDRPEPRCSGRPRPFQPLRGQLGCDRPGCDRPGCDRPGCDRPGCDRPGCDQTIDCRKVDQPGRCSRVGQLGCFALREVAMEARAIHPRQPDLRRASEVMPTIAHFLLRDRL